MAVLQLNLFFDPDYLIPGLAEFTFPALVISWIGVFELLEFSFNTS